MSPDMYTFACACSCAYACSCACECVRAECTVRYLTSVFMQRKQLMQTDPIYL